MIITTLLIASMVFTIYFTVKIDAVHILNDDLIDDHTPRWWLRFFITLAYAFTSLFVAASFAFIFWALFDSWLNKLRGKPLSYMGKTAKTDIFFTKRIKLYWTTKILSLLLGIYFLTLV
jgi:hypothetical protein